jgi:hypothetical protein
MFNDLSNDDINYIAKYLDFQSITNLRLTSRRFNCIQTSPTMNFFESIKNKNIGKIETFNDNKNCIVPYLKYRFMTHPIINNVHAIIKWFKLCINDPVHLDFMKILGISFWKLLYEYEPIMFVEQIVDKNACHVIPMLDIVTIKERPKYTHYPDTLDHTLDKFKFISCKCLRYIYYNAISSDKLDIIKTIRETNTRACYSRDHMSANDNMIYNPDHIIGQLYMMTEFNCSYDTIKYIFDIVPNIYISRRDDINIIFSYVRKSTNNDNLIRVIREKCDNIHAYNMTFGDRRKTYEHIKSLIYNNVQLHSYLMKHMNN